MNFSSMRWTVATAAVVAAFTLGGCGGVVDPQADGEDVLPEDLATATDALTPAGTAGGWFAYNFKIASGSAIPCTGARSVRYVSKYSKWVGAALCGSKNRYKLYMSSSQTGTYYEVADYAGNGQDHCELVNTQFTLPNEDDITSGGCTNCAVGALTDPNGVQVYARGYLGEAFSLVTASDWGDLSTEWYECGVPVTEWRTYSFKTYEGVRYCSGARYVHYVPKYNKWVGAELCTTSSRYKLYMSSSETGTYYEIADYSGHGQDHCELINKNFTLPNDDDITSGGCTTCALGNLLDPIGVPVYARGYFGEAFNLVTSTDWGDLSTDSYSCGVSIQ
ncbi:hypothetical protein [Hyalangium versicolor]|uniref:hypothetical protein n=1 Tax=Hyalangium versicolor TaxID=2861190 RepID=UPI001CCBDA3A|nr:hypothetical protein [Hyalangium versicolor]